MAATGSPASKRSPAKKAPAKKAPAKKAAPVKKAAAAAPVLRTVSAGTYAKQRLREKRDARTQQRRAARGGRKVTAAGRELPALPKARGLLTSSNPRRLLLAELLVCLTVLGLGTVVAPRGSKDGVPRLMVRATALSALFLILALASSAGRTAAKGAAGLGALVTVTYLVGSSDATDIFAWASQYFSRQGTGGAGLPTPSPDLPQESPVGEPGALPPTENRPPSPGEGPGGTPAAGTGPANPGGANKSGLL
jgi:hypothetical protein